MKGAIGKETLIKLGLAVIVAGLLLLVITPILQSTGANVQSCGAFRSWLADLSSGGADLC